MSYVTVVPEAVMASASDLANLGSTISEANAAAAAPTTNLVAAAQDEVSTAIAALFGSHARQFQALSAKAAVFYDQFVQALTGGAASYVETEAANVLGLMVGSQAAAAAPAAVEDIPFGSIFNFLFGLGAPQAASFLGNISSKTESFVGQLEPMLEANFRNAELAARAMRVQQIVANGLKLIGQDGAQLYTNGRELVAIGGRYAFDLYTPDFLYARRFITDAWGISPQTLGSLFDSEIHVVFRGEGLAQNYFQKIGNAVYQIDTNVQGQIISKVPTTEAIFREYQSPQARDVLKYFETVQNDVYNIINQAEEHALRQAEQASRQLAEQALREAQRIVEEAERAGLIK